MTLNSKLCGEGMLQTTQFYVSMYVQQLVNKSNKQIQQNSIANNKT